MVCGWRVCRIVGEVEMLPWKGRRAQKQNTRAEVAPCIFRGHVVKNYNIIIYIYIYICKRYALACARRRVLAPRFRTEIAAPSFFLKPIIRTRHLTHSASSGRGAVIAPALAGAANS